MVVYRLLQALVLTVTWSWSVVGEDLVEPEHDEIHILVGQLLVLRWTSCVTYLDHTCTWFYKNQNTTRTEFLYCQDGDREDVLDRASQWNFTDPDKACVGLEKIATLDDTGTYWLDKGEGSERSQSRPTHVTVLEDLSYTVTIGDVDHDYTLEDSLNHTLPSIYTNKNIIVQVKLGPNFPSSTTVTIKEAGEKMCRNQSVCDGQITAGAQQILVVIDTYIQGAEQIVLTQPVHGEIGEHGVAFAVAVILGVICAVLLCVACIFGILWFRLKRQKDVEEKLLMKKSNGDSATDRPLMKAGDGQAQAEGDNQPV